MPAITPTTLSAQLKAARAKTRGGRPLAFKSYDTWQGPETVVVEEQKLTVRECRSDLEVREAMGTVSSNELVLLVRVGADLLAEDTLARFAKGRLLDLNPRDTLMSLAGAHAIDPRLLIHREVIDLLVQRWRADVKLTSSANVIECGRAFAFLLGRSGLASDAPDLVGLLLWSLEDGLVSLVQAPPVLQQAFFDWLRESHGPAIVLIESALADNAGRLVSLGLALGAIFPTIGQPSEVARDAAIRLEPHLGDVDVSSSAARSWHGAAKTVLSRIEGRQQKEILREVDSWLEELKVGELAVDCDFSPRGFELRLDDFATALQAACRGVSAKSWDGLLDAERRLKAHWLASLDGPRIELMHMALRLTKWLRQAREKNSTSHGLGNLASEFLAEGCFVDWARQKLRRGDGRESLNKAYAALLAKVDEHREETNTGFASSLHRWIANDTKEDGVIPVENVLEQVIAPLAKETKVLLLVMDGMNGAIFAELMTDLDKRGWYSMRSASEGLPKPVIAALPSITCISRAALFRGRLDATDVTSETVNFREHSAIQSKPKPQLFLKPSLADSGGAGLSSQVRDAITESNSRVVGVVINAVDDQLSTLGQLDINWSVNQIARLRDILDAAAIGQRVVVLMSDHGHVPAKETDRSLQLKNAEGDRHRGVVPDAKEGEMLFSGPRLRAATGTNKWIFSRSESLRYGGKKHGYHGGVADQEVIIPLAILSASSDNIGSFEATDFRLPEWWSLNDSSRTSAMSGLANLSLTPRKKKALKAPAEPLELWAASGAPVPETLVSPPDSSVLKSSSWVGTLLKSEVMQQQKALSGRVHISEDQIIRCLGLLESKSGVIPLVSLASELGLPQFRVSGFVAQLQRLLNVEGYPVAEMDASQTLRLNKELLFKQFDIRA
jgi:hypothetical protein